MHAHDEEEGEGDERLKLGRHDEVDADQDVEERVDCDQEGELEDGQLLQSEEHVRFIARRVALEETDAIDQKAQSVENRIEDRRKMRLDGEVEDEVFLYAGQDEGVGNKEQEREEDTD